MIGALSIIQNLFLHWIGAVADAVAPLLEPKTPRHIIRLTEGDNSQFAVDTDEQFAKTHAFPLNLRIANGQIEELSPSLAQMLPSCRVEMILQPGRFIFRPFDFPARAIEFLEGVVRAQLDRLTPWNPVDAAFGWSKPKVSGLDLMTITVAATALNVLEPQIRAIAALGPKTVSVWTQPPASSGSGLVKVWEKHSGAGSSVHQVRQWLIGVLAAVLIFASASFVASIVADMYLNQQQQELFQKIKSAQAGIQPPAGHSNTAAPSNLVIRKHQHPAAVLVLDALSRILPDDTYVTELQIEDQRLRIVGVTRDAPSLIGILEQSGRFPRATFFAPTTRSSSEAKDRFHIEVSVPKEFGARS
jgi:general secretion pathway protein L